MTRKDITTKLTVELDRDQIENLIRAAVREEMHRQLPTGITAGFYIDVDFAVRQDFLDGATATATITENGVEDET